jgi:hypothetical protein
MTPPPMDDMSQNTIDASRFVNGALWALFACARMFIALGYSPPIVFPILIGVDVAIVFTVTLLGSIVTPAYERWEYTRSVRGLPQESHSLALSAAQLRLDSSAPGLLWSALAVSFMTLKLPADGAATFLCLYLLMLQFVACVPGMFRADRAERALRSRRPQ